MKELELRQHADCTGCGKKIGHTGLPLFWRVTVERFGIDMQAVKKQSALAEWMGNATLARAMGTDDDMATPVMAPVTITLCEQCSVDCQLPIAALAEHGASVTAEG